MHFCWFRLFQNAQESIYKDKSVKVDLDSLYDPCFLLQLFGELTRPGKHSHLLGVKLALWVLESEDGGS
jgi:hypothetical protein